MNFLRMFFFATEILSLQVLNLIMKLLWYQYLGVVLQKFCNDKMSSACI